MFYRILFVFICQGNFIGFFVIFVTLFLTIMAKYVNTQKDLARPRNQVHLKMGDSCRILVG